MKIEEVTGESLNIGDKVSPYADYNDEDTLFEVFSIDKKNNLITMKHISGKCHPFQPETDGTYHFNINGMYYNRLIEDKPIEYNKIVKKIFFKYSILDFIMGNLEFYPLLFCLLFLYHAPFDWRLWVTILSVGICAGVSQSYSKNK